MKGIPATGSALNIGGQQAESDPLLEDAFYATHAFNLITSKVDRRCFLIGRTGAGKSAALQQLEEMHPDHVIRINPEDLAMPFITNLQAVKYLDGLGVNLDNFWVTLWKHVLLVEVLRHRYKIDSPAAKQNFLSGLRARIERNPAKKAAIEYLDEYEGKFWCETDERVKQITENFSQRIDREFAANASGGVAHAKAGTARATEESIERRAEEVDRFQRVVNESQLARLNQMIKVLNEDILENGQEFTYIVIDDLDRDWVDFRVANDLIRCLFRTVLDLQRVRNLKVLVALRTNLFQELDFGRRGAGQEEKYRALILPIDWTSAELTALLDERVRVASRRAGVDVASLRHVLPNANKSRGNPVDYVLQRTLMRPRDAIAFLNGCFEASSHRFRITWDAIVRAEREYSRDRLLALRDEWKTTYPDIDKVFQVFNGAQMPMDKESYTARLDAAAMLMAEPSFLGTRWMTDATEALFAKGDAPWEDTYQRLTQVLFEIGLIGLSRPPARAALFYADEPRASQDRTLLRNCGAFYVHRAFQAALDITTSRDTRR